MASGQNYIMSIINGKLHYRNNERNWELCRVNPKWLFGEYYLTVSEKPIIEGLSIEEIFTNHEFVNAEEFKIIGLDKKYRIRDDTLQYYNEGKWIDRTIDNSIYNRRFILNKK
jgi:hypothetical protein